MWMLLLLPQHLAQNHWSSQKIGWAMGVFFLMYLGAQILAGNLAQRIGNVPTALVGTGMAILGGLLYLSSLHTLNLLFVARVFHGIGAGMIQAGVIIHLIESVPPHLKGPMIGYYGLPGFVMLGAGPYLAQFLQEHWELQATFYVLLLNFAATAAVLLALPRPLVPPRRLRRFFRAMKVNFPRLKSILTFSLIFGFCISAWHSFLGPCRQPHRANCGFLFWTGLRSRGDNCPAQHLSNAGATPPTSGCHLGLDPVCVVAVRSTPSGSSLALRRRWPSVRCHPWGVLPCFEFLRC